MRIGCPKEIKNSEYRVGLTPESAAELVTSGHQVMVETNAGIGIGATDGHYEAAGAEVVDGPDDVFDLAEMIVKVKEPQPVERQKLKPGQVLYTYLHLAPDPEQTRELVESGAICIAYETITDEFGGLPLLKPMSQVAGRLSVQAGANALEKARGGRGVLLGGVPGVAPAKVVIIGGGVVGSHAAEMAVGLRADVTVVDRDPRVLERISDHFRSSAKAVYSTRSALHELVSDADLVIGAVLARGAAAPKLVTREMLQDMKPGSVLVDVAIDQGGCFETSRPTTHDDPTFIVDDIIHYCVANMPGAVSRTSTYALNNATLGHAKVIADKGWRSALLANEHLLNGLNVHRGHVTCAPVADSLGYAYTPARELIGNA